VGGYWQETPQNTLWRGCFVSVATNGSIRRLQSYSWCLSPGATTTLLERAVAADPGVQLVFPTVVLEELEYNNLLICAISILLSSLEALFIDEIGLL